MPEAFEEDPLVPRLRTKTPTHPQIAVSFDIEDMVNVMKVMMGGGDNRGRVEVVMGEEIPEKYHWAVYDGPELTDDKIHIWETHP